MSLVALHGFFDSGVGAVGDLLREYSDVDVFCPPLFVAAASGETPQDPKFCGINLFDRLGLGELYNSILTEVPDRVSSRISDLLWSLTSLKDNTPYWEALLSNVTELLLNLLELNDFDKWYIREHPQTFALGQGPSSLNEWLYTLPSDDPARKYTDLSFVRGGYWFYRINHELALPEIADFIRKFVSDFYRSISTAPVSVVADLFHTRPLEDVAELLPQDLKQIVVYRDPRDIFFTLMCSPDLNANIYPPNFIRTCNAHQLLSRYRSNERRLLVKLEDLVCNTQSEIKRIESFLGLLSAQRKLEGTYFDSKILGATCGAWSNYHEQSVMDLIAASLEDWL